MFHGQFLSVSGLTLFTEHGLERTLARYQSLSAGESAGSLRWSPCDSPHHLFGQHYFSESDHLFMALEQHRPDDRITLEVERICLRVVRELNAARIFPSDVVLTLAEGDQGWAERYAYAERFLEQRTLERFRDEIPELNESHLDHWRSRIPDF